MNKTCDKCKHFTQGNLYKDLGSCALMGDANDLPSWDCATRIHGADVTKAYGWDYEGYSAGVYVGPKFGCIHWEKK